MKPLDKQINDIISKKDELKNIREKWFGLNNQLETQERKIRSLKFDLENEKSKDKGGLGCITQIVVLGYVVILFFVINYLSDYPEDTTVGVLIMVVLGLIPGFFIWISTIGKGGKKQMEEKVENQKKIKNKTQDEIQNIDPTIKTLVDEISLLEEYYSITSNESLIEMFDKNKNQEIDSLEGPDDFILLIQTNQHKIIEFDKSENKDFIKLFVQLHERIELKRNNINTLFTKILNYKGPYDQKVNHTSLTNVIENEIYSYNVLLTNSIFMVSSLINDDRITFYKIYQRFDKLDIFNSHFENESLRQLKNVNNNLIEVVNSIEEMNYSITSELQEINYITQKNTEIIQENLNQINSSINLHTLINSINTYQNYKTNKNTKSLKP